MRSVVAFKLFGKSIGSVRTLENMHNALLFVLIGLFALKLFKDYPLFAFVAVLIPSDHIVKTFMLPSVLTRDITTFGFLIACLSIYGHFDGKRRNPAGLLIAGFFFSFIPIAAFAYSLDRGVFLTAALFVFLPPLYFFFSGRTGFFWRPYLLAALSGAVFLAVLLGGGAVEFIKFVFFTMPGYKDLMDGKVYPFQIWSAFLVCAVYALNGFWLVRRFLCELRQAEQARRGPFLKTIFQRLQYFSCRYSYSGTRLAAPT